MTKFFAHRSLTVALGAVFYFCFLCGPRQVFGGAGIGGRRNSITGDHQQPSTQLEPPNPGHTVDSAGPTLDLKNMRVVQTAPQGSQGHKVNWQLKVNGDENNEQEIPKGMMPLSFQGDLVDLEEKPNQPSE